MNTGVCAMFVKVTSTVAADDTAPDVAVTLNSAFASAATSAALRLSTALVGDAIVTAGPLTCVHAYVSAAPPASLDVDASSVKGCPSCTDVALATARAVTTTADGGGGPTG